MVVVAIMAAVMEKVRETKNVRINLKYNDYEIAQPFIRWLPHVNLDSL